MLRRRLGQTDLEVSVIGFGCSRLGGYSEAGKKRKAAHALLNAAVDAGINLFDTADAYGDGDSEAVLGEALHRRRSEVIIATKGGYRFDEYVGSTRPWEPLRQVARKGQQRFAGAQARFTAQDFSATYLRKAVESSLRRLRTDYIDLYQLHAPRSAQAQDDALLSALEALQREGKVRYVGVGLEDLDDVPRWAQCSAVAAIQLPFGLLDQEALDEAIPAAAASGTGLLVRGVFGGGWLGPARSDQEVYSDRKWRRILAYRQLAAERDIDTCTLALNIALHPPGVTAAIVGMRTMAHLETNLARALWSDVPSDIWRYVRCVHQYAPLGP